MQCRGNTIGRQDGTGTNQRCFRVGSRVAKVLALWILDSALDNVRYLLYNATKKGGFSTMPDHRITKPGDSARKRTLRRVEGLSSIVTDSISQSSIPPTPSQNCSQLLTSINSAQTIVPECPRLSHVFHSLRAHIAPSRHRGLSRSSFIIPRSALSPPPRSLSHPPSSIRFPKISQNFPRLHLHSSLIHSPTRHSVKFPKIPRISPLFTNSIHLPLTQPSSLITQEYPRVQSSRLRAIAVSSADSHLPHAHTRYTVQTQQQTL